LANTTAAVAPQQQRWCIQQCPHVPCRAAVWLRRMTPGE